VVAIPVLGVDRWVIMALCRSHDRPDAKARQTLESKAIMIVRTRLVSGRLSANWVVFVTALIACEVDGGLACTVEPPAVTVTTAPPQVLQPGDPHTHGLTDADLDALREILRKAVDDHTAPGVSFLLAHKGEVVFKEAFGNLAVDQTVQMASSSKPVTATLIMILADQGKLLLDDPIEKYLLEFKVIAIKGKPPARQPTVRHLLCNMSGLPGDFLAESMLRRLRKEAGQAQNGDDKGNSQGRFFSSRNRSLSESVRVVATAGLVTEPGAEFHYCTMGFNVAARVAEVAGKHPFEELVRTELLEPMGLKSTRYIPIGLQAMNSSPTLSNGESRFVMAGGGMTSTLDDFAAFYQMHLNGGSYRGHQILSERAVATMETRQAKLELLMTGPYGKDYGLAFFLDKLDDRSQARFVSHAGLFGTTPWLDRDRDLVGVFFAQSNFLRTMSLVRELQAKVRDLIPATKLP
jgi:CubicO group peptidase (beta-lactamase class C family)